MPNPDVNTFDPNIDNGNQNDIESISGENPDDKIPVPPDVQRDNIPIEEPPGEQDKAPIDEDGGDDIERIV